MEAISLTASKLQGPSSTITKNVEDVRVKTTKEGNSGQNSVNEANSYNKYDTLELSQDYLEYKTKSENSAVTSDVNQLNATITQMFAGKPPQESSDAESIVKNTQTAASYTVTSDSEVISSYKLSSYSALELKSLVQEGKITSADYNAEIKSRQVDQETPKQSENLKTTSKEQTTSII